MSVTSKKNNNHCEEPKLPAGVNLVGDEAILKKIATRLPKLIFGNKSSRSRWFLTLFFVVFLITAYGLLLTTHKASAATIYVSPGSGSFSVGSTFNVSVLTNTQGSPVNTAEAQITYSTNTLDLISASQGSTFYLSSPGSPAKGSGSAYFAGGLPNPGYTGGSGTLGVMTFRAKAEGAATIAIVSGQVLLNDGNGTNAYSGGSGAKYTITVAAAEPTPTPTATGSLSVIVSSGSHPKTNSWYSKSNLDLTWNRPGDAYGYSFDLDQNPSTVPDNTLDTTVTTIKSYSGLKDGVWYFHIKARPQSPSSSFGPTTHFKAQIDTTPPESFDLSFANNALTFEAKDVTSGIDRYEIYTDDQFLDKVNKAPYNLTNLGTGSHLIKVLAFDLAGNQQSAQLNIAAAKFSFFGKSLNIPVYLLLLMNLLILILLIIILWLLFARRRKDKQPMAYDLQQDINDTLEALKRSIDKKLLSLTSKSSEDLFDKEIKVAKAVSADISKTKKKIESKIDRAQRKR